MCLASRTVGSRLPYPARRALILGNDRVRGKTALGFRAETRSVSERIESSTGYLGGEMSAMTQAELWGEADRRRLVGLCAAVSGDREAAEDLAQETLLEAWRNAHKLRDPEGVDRWLAAIARNVCRRW